MEDVAIQDALSTIQTGEFLHKVSGGMQWRFFQVDAVHKCLTYTSMNKPRGSPDTIFPMARMVRVKSGCRTQRVRNKLKPFQKPLNNKFPFLSVDECCFHIEFKGNRSLDLVASNAKSRDRWVNGLQAYAKLMQKVSTRMGDKEMIAELFKKADKDSNGLLNLHEIVSFLKILNINLETTPPEVQDELAGIGIDLRKYGSRRSDLHIGHQTFQDMYQLLTRRKELEDIIEYHKHEGGLETVGDVKKFLKIDMDIFDVRCKTVYQDMTQPLSHYFIASSHNTYLYGGQMLGETGVSPYRNALEFGARCLELDCYAGDHGEPTIKHGPAWTGEVKFGDIIKVVNDYIQTDPDEDGMDDGIAEDGTELELHPEHKHYEYPVILSVEQHCSDLGQQARMVNHLKEILGNKLYEGPLPADGRLPSPHDLKGKVIIKAEVDEKPTNDGEKHQKLTDCVVICRIKKGRKIDKQTLSENNNNPDYTEILNISEMKATELANGCPENTIMCTRTQLCRVYPAWHRWGSSNFNPLPMWGCGSQVVALNYQNGDEFMHIYRGLFLNNGGCGYILKPEFLRHDEPIHPIKGPFPHSTKLVVRVISGFHLPKAQDDDVLDPYIMIFVDGLGLNQQTRSTRHISNNGLHPIWNSDPFEFDILEPELSLLRFYVMDENWKPRDPVVAQYCLPVSCINPGHRIVYLKDVDGRDLEEAQLLVHVELQGHVDVELQGHVDVTNF